MKKSVYFILGVVASLIIGLTIYLSQTLFDLKEIIMLIALSLLIIFALFIGVRKIKSIKNNEPTEDEYSMNHKKLAASKSYMISLYLWLGILYLNSNSSIDSEILIGGGIIGMGILFAITWLFYYFRGTNNE